MPGGRAASVRALSQKRAPFARPSVTPVSARAAGYVSRVITRGAPSRSSAPAPAYELAMPERRDTGTVFASPHSGRLYPRDMMARAALGPHAIRSSEDAFVEELWSGVTWLGAPLLSATYARAYVDLNRAVDELDPAIVEGVGRAAHNPRIASGLGVIPRVVAGGRAIQGGKLSMEEARARLERAWVPYHGALRRLLTEARETFGRAILIDCHSMPHEAIEGGARRPQIVLGDRFGAASAPGIVDRIEAAFAAAGLRVARNAPFAGAWTAQNYGRPAIGQHAVQIEIDRSLYMDEALIRKTSDFDAVKALLTRIAAEICEEGRALPLAAE